VKKQELTGPGLDCLLFLVTEGAGILVRQTPLAKQSAVQQRFLKAKQMKNLQQRGAHLFLIFFQGENLIEPVKKAT